MHHKFKIKTSTALFEKQVKFSFKINAFYQKFHFYLARIMF